MAMTSLLLGREYMRIEVIFTTFTSDGMQAERHVVVRPYNPYSRCYIRIPREQRRGIPDALPPILELDIVGSV